MEIDLQSAVSWIVEILNTNVLVIGTTSITIGYIILLILKWIFPNNKIINNQSSTIGLLEDENLTLKETNEQLLADVQRLKQQMEIVLTNSQNKKYKQALNIDTIINAVEKLNVNVVENEKKTKKVKVKKGN